MFSSRSPLQVVLGLLTASATAYWLPETLGSSVTTCIVPKNTTGNDDSPSVTATVEACSNASRIIFSGNETYNLMTPISFTDLTNVEFVINGNVSLPSNVSYVESVTGNSDLYSGHWITVKDSTGVTFTGTQDPSSGWFIGHGEQWWPMVNNSDNDYRPHFFEFSVTTLRLRDVKVYNPVAWVFSLSGTDIYMTNTTLDARSSDPINAFPFNTDGMDLSASDVVIDTWTSWNGDDVLNVAPPATNVTMRNIVAYGTHGVSVSCSPGTGGDYLFENAFIYDSLLGARFKGDLGTTCNLSNVTWRNFAIFNTSYPVHFIENYVDQETGVAAGTNTSLAAYTTNFTWENIVAMTSEELGDGSCITDPCWTYTDGQSNQKAMYIMCKDAAHCQDFHFDDIVLFGADGKPGEMDCSGLEGVEGMGIPCTNGTLPTQ
ncbi:family 28 glycoside hydrolase [Cryphonectria parasitica EP155]|uniref:Family 28 glycoside hydrolase n=1 Tax=Cryphonectria parasitica (strain ATCC 38755 / EP155) TaxID=660469 RepID=A0A9P4Y4Y8_CRYP1|nr:family 28 glycoside hydrolase [Cryphonectria parasitica EP155]KAF3766628.1 family 28 glycoside hydrolase [Cryphonectria parasitica EP155]